MTIRGTVPTTVLRPSGLIRQISLPGKAPSVSASREPIAIRPLPGVIERRSPDFTLPAMDRVGAKVLEPHPAHQHAFDAAIGGGHQRLFDQRQRLGHARRAARGFADLAPVGQAAAIALDDRVAVEADDLVEQFGAKAVHHAHHDDQRGDAERDGADVKPATTKMNPSPLAGSR